MITSERFFGMLGLCMRAGQLVTGEDTCRKLIRGGECALMLLDGGTSMNTRRRFEAVCGMTGVPLHLCRPGACGTAIGRGNRMCVAVRRGALGSRLLEQLQTESSHNIE